MIRHLVAWACLLGATFCLAYLAPILWHLPQSDEEFYGALGAFLLGKIFVAIFWLNEGTENER